MIDNPGKKLFAEFPPVSPAQWDELIREDLKGADYEKKLIWPSLEGIPIRPCYRQEDLKGLEHLDHTPGEFPYVRGKRTRSNEWLVRQDIVVDDITSANSKALDALMRGAGSIGFVLDERASFTREDITRLLKDICLASAEVNFSVRKPSPDLLRMIDRENASRGGTLSELHGSIEYDPIGTLMVTGNYPADEEGSFGIAAAMADDAARLPNFTVVSVNASLFHNAGGSAVHDLAFAIASAAEYLERMTKRGVPAANAAAKIRFTFAAGRNYFMEIAKFRAARYLWAKITEAWGAGPETAGRMFIHAVTSGWNKTMYDPYVNLLRSTTESMSAILGGADSLCADPFDKPLRKEGTAFSERLVRNIQLILKEEAYFDKVADPSAGSYYIESLTGALIDESWKLFLETVEAGGMTEAFKNGFVQERIEEAATRRDSYLASRRDVLLGTNQYPDLNEKIPGDTDLSALRPQYEPAEDQIAGPLRLYRGAMAFEEIRMRTEKHPEGAPGVFLLTLGDPVMRRARAGFSAGFFGCAGFDVKDNQGFASADEGIRAARESGAEIVVVCSSDAEYPEVVPAITGGLGKESIIVVAGYPKESIDRLKEAGVRHFIHIKSNIPETLRQFQKELGIV